MSGYRHLSRRVRPPSGPRLHRVVVLSSERVDPATPQRPDTRGAGAPYTHYHENDDDHDDDDSDDKDDDMANPRWTRFRTAHESRLMTFRPPSAWSPPAHRSLVPAHRPFSSSSTSTSGGSTNGQDGNGRGHPGRSRPISSIGFSGAGFLAAYHWGVAACLLDQHWSESQLRTSPAHSSSSSFSPSSPYTFYCASPPPPGVRRRYPWLPLTGVSSGALVAAAVLAGVAPTDALDAILDVAADARAAGPLNSLTPGFCLVDQLAPPLRRLLRHACHDDDDFLRRHRYDHGRLLRIGLTDRRALLPRPPSPPGIGGSPPPAAATHHPTAYCYVDRYDGGVDDVVAAGLLSSYIPGVTGPILGNQVLPTPAPPPWVDASAGPAVAAARSWLRPLELVTTLAPPFPRSLRRGTQSLPPWSMAARENRVSTTPVSETTTTTTRNGDDHGGDHHPSADPPATTKPPNSAVFWANRRLRHMIAHYQAVKCGSDGRPLQLDHATSSTNHAARPKDDHHHDDHETLGVNGPDGDDSIDSMRELCWDGGLVNAFPVWDDRTLMVSPIAATFPTHSSINPSLATIPPTAAGASSPPHVLRLLNNRVQIHWSTANAHAFSSLLVGSDDATLQRWFADGYDHANLWWQRQGGSLAYVTVQAPCDVPAVPPPSPTTKATALSLRRHEKNLER